ncbi:MAG: 50S ribosomal protein L25 [Candidatus Doudnabacteria bacterium]|nr:50S ribosomal protein L25 [Candidatus Doudnabacteria bacterium]
MDKVQLKAKARDVRTNLKNLRNLAEVPAVLYGHNVKNESLAVKKSDFDKAFKKAGESTLIDLVTEDGKTHPVLIHEVQLHYLTSEPIHVDFYQVSMTEKLKAAVALEFTGEASAVKTLGGVLVRVLNEVEVQCLPADLPHNIPVDISSLVDFQSAIHVKDLKIPGKVQILTAADEVVAKVQPPRDIEAEIAKETAAADAEKTAVEAVVAASEKPKAEEAGTEGPVDGKAKSQEEKPKSKKE